MVKSPQNFLWIPEKLAENGDFRKILGPIWDFSIKEGFKIRDPQILWYPLGTKSREMWGPPVLTLGNVQGSMSFSFQLNFVIQQEDALWEPFTHHNTNKNKKTKGKQTKNQTNKYL